MLLFLIEEGMVVPGMGWRQRRTLGVMLCLPRIVVYLLLCRFAGVLPLAFPIPAQVSCGRITGMSLGA